MMQLYLANKPLIDFFLISVGFAYSQQIVFRAGVFSIATAGFAALGAYCTAIMVTRYGMPFIVAVACGTLLGGFAGLALSIPLARLRGAFQAIATLAFVQIILSLLLYGESFTGGALGILNIPRAVDTLTLMAAVAATMYISWSIGRTSLGRTFDALRQNETVAASLGVSVGKYHGIAFILSGAIGGLFGALQSLYVFSIEPHDYGFHLIVAILTMVVLGGRTTLLGPLLGALILTLIPEIARPLAEYRPLVNGLILILVIIFLPSGVGDSIVHWFDRRRRAARRAKTPDTTEAPRAVTVR
jgi:branched-chain amino acid transport system permease protein